MAADSGPLPAPPLPPYIDLRELEYLPVAVQTLRDCRLAVEESPEVYKAATMLWWASWHQLPAGSLPNNESELCLLAGLKRDVEAWRELCTKMDRRVRRADRSEYGGSQWKIRRKGDLVVHRNDPALSGGISGPLRGFVLCTDDRFYHPLICFLAVQSWNALSKIKYDRDYDRLRKNNQIRRSRGEIPIVLTPPTMVDFGWGYLVDKNDPSVPQLVKSEATILRKNGKMHDSVRIASQVLPLGTTEVPKNKSSKEPRVLNGVPKKENLGEQQLFQSTSQETTGGSGNAITLAYEPPAVREALEGRHTPRPDRGQGARERDAVEAKREAVTTEVWKAYADAYFARYGTEPLRNVTVNSQMKLFVQRVGREHAPLIAAFYVTLNTRFYVEKMHAVGPMVRDAEALYTQWKTGQPMTAARATQVDKTANNAQSFRGLIEEAQRQEGDDGIPAA